MKNVILNIFGFAIAGAVVCIVLALIFVLAASDPEMLIQPPSYITQEIP